VTDTRTDRWVGLGLGVAYALWLLASAKSLGYTRDEGFYFVAANDYQSWFRLLWQDPGAALDFGAIDRYFRTNNEHPAGMKLAFAASHWLLHDVLGWLAPGTAYRFPAMALSGVAVAVLYDWGTREFGRAAGCVAAAGFAWLPRVFFHAHLACFDVPVAALGLVTFYCYSRSLRSRSWVWVLAAGVAFGAQLDTKNNSVFLAPAVLLHFALVSGRRPSMPRAWLGLFVLAPLLFFLGWPWLWADPLGRIVDYARFHLNHDHYNIEFLGVTRYVPPFPRAYAWLMTAATVPLSILVPFVFGLLIALRAFYDESRRAGWFRVELSRAESTWLLWCVALAANYAPWWSANTPIYGGTKHWITAYPFLCLLAALGVHRVGQVLSAPVATAVSVLAAPFAITLSSHPHGLSSYTPLVGGAVGAAELGLNRGFWGYETGALAADLNRVAPRDALAYLHDTLGPSFRMLQADGRLRSDLRGSLDLPRTDVALYHHEPHMGRVEGQIWIAYGTTTPVAIITHDGVPVAWLYRRP
jgi:4-amino-4-deoxy-L-arabinose transferase-like glycosyltransferase